MIAPVRLALLLAAFLLAIGTAPAQTHTISGTWTLQGSGYGGRMQLELSSGAGLHSMQWQESLRLDTAPSGADFYQRREAGTFHFTGTIGNGRGSGQFTFDPSDAFVSGLTARGLRFDEEHDIMSAATVDLTLAYIDSIRADGYPQLGFSDLLAFRALEVTPASIAQLRGIFGPMSAQDVVSTTALHVNRAYVDQLRAMHIPGITPQRAVTFKSLNITKAYVDELASLGYRDMNPEDLVAFKALHIDAAYLRHLAGHGLKNLTAQQVIEMKATGL